MKNEKNNFGFIAASSICIFLLLIVLVGNVGGKGTRAAISIDGYSCTGGPFDAVDINKCGYSYGQYAVCSGTCTGSQEAGTLSCTGYTYTGCVKENSSGDGQTCSKGEYLSNGTCTTCPANSYCPDGKEAISCSSVYTNSVSQAGSKYKTDCKCLSGYYKDNSQTPNTCTICPKGSYCNGISKSNCSEGYTTSGTGASSADKCIKEGDGTQKITKTFSCKSKNYVNGTTNYTFTTADVNGFDSNILNTVSTCTVNTSDGTSKCSLTLRARSGYYFLNGDVQSSSSSIECTVNNVPKVDGIKLNLPSCATNTYDGSPKNLLKSTGEFSVTSGTATNAGKHPVKVKANSGYYWLVDGQKKTEYSLECEIDKGRPKFSLSSSSGVVWINSDASFSINTIDNGPCGTVSYSLDYSNGSIFTDGNAPTISKNTVSFKATKPGNSSIVITGTSGSSTNSNCAPVSITYNLTVNESVKPYCRYCSNAAYYNYTWISDTEELGKPLPEGCSIDANKTSASQCGQCYYCPSNVTDPASADSNVRGNYFWRTSSGKALGKCNYKESYSDEKLRGLTAWQTAYDKTEGTCSGKAPDFNGPSSSSTPGGNNNGGNNNGGNNNGGNDTGSDNGGNNGGIGGGDDTGNNNGGNNGGNNNATNNPQTGSALIFVVWSIGIAMVVYAFWYFKTSKEY